MLVLGLLMLLMLLILVIAGAIVVYVAYPHRGEEVPGAPWIGEAMKRGVDTVGDLLERPADQTPRSVEREHADH
jgi:uncharacterized iron-regulated membrane protein